MRVEFTESWRCDSEIEIIEPTKPTTGTHQLQPNYASSLKIHMIECYIRTYGSDLRKTGTYEKMGELVETKSNKLIASYF